MDRKWMYPDNRACSEFVCGVFGFIAAAERYKRDFNLTSLCCPCCDCNNKRRYNEAKHLHSHLILRGFMKNYEIWNQHGEEGENPGEVDEACLDGRVSEGHQDDTCEDVPHVSVDEDVHDAEENYNGIDGSDDLVDVAHHLDQMMMDGIEGDDNYGEGEFAKFKELVANSKTLLYPNCDKEEYTKLYSVLKLLQLKSKHRWSDVSFNGLLMLLRDMLPTGNVLPKSTYEAKKIICPLGLEVEKIHACVNDCVLFRGDNAEMNHCPDCGTSRYKRRNDGGDSKRKGAPRKVMWYFPIVPRLKRLFACKKDAQLMRWHSEGRKDDEYLRHPADSAQWRNINSRYGKHFANELRNIRFGLSTDGMNPFSNMSTSHSTWPVVLTIFNLPPWLCHKRKYMMLSTLISGPKEAGIDIDLYLRPLVDDLKMLWDTGVEVWDQHKREYFNLKAMLFCTIQDLPAQRNLTGQRKGEKDCPQCLDDTESVWLKHSKKRVYMRHRRFLPKSHPWRKMKEQFDGTHEKAGPPRHFSGDHIYEQVKDMNVVLGKQKRTSKSEEIPMWRKKSIFWELPYWKYLDVRHTIDLMHLIKNVCEAILGTFLNIKGKSKDHENARADLEEMELRPELCPEDCDTRLPTSCVTLSRKEKKELCQFLRSVKVPTGFSSNIGKKVSVSELKLVGTKSHDCHVLMTMLLAVAIRNILPVNVREAVMSLCFFFNAISQKIIDDTTLDQLEKNVMKTLCLLEAYFPPSFFDIMVHLIAHLVKEVRYLGPVFLHWMYPYERYLAILKAFVRNRASPEGCIVEGYSTEEVVEWCVGYIDPNNSIGVPKSRYEGRLSGKGTLGKKAIIPELDLYQKAHFHVLQQSKVVSPYIEKHKEMLRQENPERGEAWIAKTHMARFNIWFRDEMQMSSSNTRKLLRNLAKGPLHTVITYQAYEINGYTFYTRFQDEKSANQNSGVRIDAYDNNMQKDSYYGQIEEIWELRYVGFKMALFKCRWVEGKRGVQKDRYGFTTVDLEKNGYKQEPFVLAKQVFQVFYVQDTVSLRRRVVLPGKRRILGVEDVVDEDEYNQFDEIPPFATCSFFADLNTSSATPYVRTDHKEGILRQRRRGKKKADHEENTQVPRDIPQSNRTAAGSKSRRPQRK